MSRVEFRLVVIKTSQLSALRRFYEQLGLAFVEEQHGKGPIHFSANVAGIVLEIYPLPNDVLVDASTRLGFAVENLTAVCESLRSISAEVKGPSTTPWGERAVAYDPDGRAIELYSLPEKP
jgi:lactoylglutathione lyase